ncbi:Putative undecaprenyl-diphosphatase YbjG [Ephemeroptericola cinctiostellae]|uniref:Undecaprenyl-diphosphatase YbjG n=1 Tax=Ephemeroptericola cinctiostellae TaxID=2268024 RepID=A0A345DC61_9BURK|nr:phosphatase PAP2 family protein [Ephemeroptericola cinctiostellae]AXF85949.1 Putative undecaprenyl-diphosphatase YbjG [Ephemeroptericola cinctiostellae]
MNVVEQFNQSVFLIINANPNPEAWMLSLARFLAHYASYAIPIVLLCAWLYGERPARARVVMAYLTVLLAMGMNLLIAYLWFHPRPFMMGLGTNFMKHGPDASFPSDHMTTASAVAWVYVLAGQRVLRVFFVLLALAVGWARIYLGVHFPLDILGSMVVALCAACFVNALWPKIGDGMMFRLEQLYRTLMAVPIRRGWVRD